jgi:hypothetical protein
MLSAAPGQRDGSGFSCREEAASSSSEALTRRIPSRARAFLSVGDRWGASADVDHWAPWLCLRRGGRQEWRSVRACEQDVRGRGRTIALLVGALITWAGLAPASTAVATEYAGPNGDPAASVSTIWGSPLEVSAGAGRAAPTDEADGGRELWRAGWVRLVVGTALLLLTLAGGGWWLFRARQRKSPPPSPCICPKCGKECRTEGQFYAHTMTAHYRGLGSPGGV